MKPGQPPFERQLRLFVAREFASRGYYLDVESFYDQFTLSELNLEELSLLARCAAASHTEKTFHARLHKIEQLDKTMADSLRLIAPKSKGFKIEKFGRKVLNRILDWLGLQDRG
jgi:hypothetical protein